MFAWNFNTGLVDSDILHRMPRKMRLSVYRKNQYRKPEAHSLEMEYPLFVSVSLESVSVMQVSISLDMYMEAPIAGLSQLQQKLYMHMSMHTSACTNHTALSVIPQGNYLYNFNKINAH